MALTTGKTALRRLRGVAPTAVLTTLALTLTGCTMGTIQLSGPATDAAAVTGMSGRLMGGEQPISGATLRVYTVGTGGYGTVVGSNTGAAAISGALTYTDANGGFSFPSYSCTNASAQTYIVATGGNPGLGSADTITGITVTGSSSNHSVQITYTGTVTISNGVTVVLTGLPSNFSYLNGSTQTVSAVSGSSFFFTDTSTSNPGNASYTGSGVVNLASNTNSAIKLVAASGPCSGLSSLFLIINEVTTAANAYALAQYIDPLSGQIGTANTSQSQTGFANALNTIPLLVSSTSGMAVTSTNLTGAGATLTAVPESAKLYTIANVIAACVNSNGSTTSGTNCSTLFTNAGYGSATDTFGAAAEMALDPFNTATKVTNLFALQTAQSPFPGGTAPTDWTLGIQYQDNTGTFFLKPQNIAVDGTGNVWVLSNAGGNGSLVAVSPTGTPTFNLTNLNEYGPFTATPPTNPPVLSSPKTTTTTLNTSNYIVTTTFGSSSNNQPGGLNPRNIAIDPSNNVWFTQSSGVSSSNGGVGGGITVPVSGNVFEVATSSSTAGGTTYGFATGKSAYGIAFDSTGNAFVGDQSNSSYFSLYEFPYNATVGMGLLQPAGFNANGTSGSEIGPEYLALDTSGNKWFTNGVAAVYKATGISASSCTNTASTPTMCVTNAGAYTAITGFTSTSIPYGIAQGTGNVMWVANSGTGTGGDTLVSVPIASTSGTAYGSNQTLSVPKFPAVDGAGNVWVANSANGNGSSVTTFTTGGSISAVTSSGTFLSPSNGGSTTVGPGYNHAGIEFGTGTAIDPSGNVWIANNQVFASACPVAITPATNTCSSIFELIGAAAPVVTPIANYSATGPARP